MADFELKQGDLEPAAAVTLMYDDGTAVDLTGVSVAFRMADSITRTEVFVRNAVVDNVAGQVTYAWQTGDTDKVGTFYAEFVVLWPGSRPQTYPEDGYLSVSIEAKL